MNRSILICLCLVVAMIVAPTSITTAQSWSTQLVQNPYFLFGVTFSDSLTGTVVGQSGKISRTTNGGTTWIAQTSGTAYSLYDVSFVNSSIGTVVGTSGLSPIILRTTDAGSTWAAQTSGITAGDGLLGVAFADSNHGIAVGYRYAGGYDRVTMRTSDGGANWTRTVGGFGLLRKVSFIDTAHATAIGDDGTILRSTNGGVSWTAQTSGTLQSLTSLSFSDSLTGTVVGAGGTILRTTNGGSTWALQTSGTSFFLTGVSFSDANNGTVVGNSVILRTTDGGTNWVHQLNPTQNLLSVFARTVNKVTACAQATIYSTSNGATIATPAASTSNPSSVDIATATMNGTVSAGGVITPVRFVYGTTSGSYTDSVLATPSPIAGATSLSNTAVSASLAALTPNTTYYVRVAADNFRGYARGAEKSFKTYAAVLPTASTNSPSGVSFSSATLNGTVQTHGPNTIVRFVWGTLSNSYADSVAATQSPITDSTITAVSAVVASLDTGTTYYVRVVASNALSYVRGSEMSFSTIPIVPATVVVSAASPIGATLANLHGTLNTHGVTTSVRFLWGTVSGTYTDSIDASESPVTDSTANSLSASVSGLSPNTTYYIRVAADNGHYYVRSSQGTFTTLPTTAPTVTTSSATSVMASGATLNGSVNTHGTSTTVRFVYGTTAGSYTDSIVAQQSPVNNFSSANVSGAAAGLLPNTTYYVRVAANNGTQYVRGNEINFTTYAGNASLSAISISPSNNYVEVPYDSLLNPAQNFTIEFWAQPQGGDGDYRCPLGTENGSIYTGFYFYDTPDNTWQCWLGDSTNWQVITGPNATLGAWDHLAMTYSTDTVKFYVNGVLYGELPAIFAPNTTMPLRIGALAEDGSVYTWNGEIDEVRLWNVVRTPQQIRDNMHRNLTGSTTNMIAYFPLNEGTGSTTASLVGGFVGTLTGSPTWVASSSPLGIGTSASASAFTTGTVALGALSLTTTDDFDNPIDLSATVLTAAPNEIPTGYTGLVGSRYFIVHAFGDGGAFSTDLSITFGPGVLPTEADAFPGGLHLYTRGSNSASSWTLVGGASSANVASGSAQWTGITSFSQFAVVVEPTGLGPVPIFVDSTATFINAQTAKVNGSVNAQGLSTTVRFLYGTVSGTYTDSVTAIPNLISDISSTPVSALLSDLSPNTTYYVRLAAFNAYNYARGPEMSFVTAPPESAGYAISFNGVDEYVSVPDDESLDLTAAVTMEAWVKFNSIGNHWIFSKDPVNTAYELYADTYSGNHFIFRINGTQASGGTPTAGVWTHVAGTYDGANLKLYVNGELVATTALTDPITTTSSPLNIGAFDYGYAAYPLDGSLDEVRLWSVARTQQQIRENMHRVVSNTAGMVAYFKFNDGAGTTVSSIVGGHVGTFVSSPAWVASSAPLGTGTSASIPGYFSSGTANFSSFTLTTTEAFDNSLSLAATMIESNPNASPAGNSSSVGVRYAVVNAIGTPGTFAAKLSINYGASTLDPRVDAFPGGLKLYRRSSFSDDAWTLVAGADTANATTGYVRWSGITALGQFAAVYDESALPVQFVAFTATADRLRAHVRWTTATELNNYGFDVERKKVGTESPWSKAGFVPGSGNSTSPKEYSFTENNLAAGRYAYRIKQIDNGGNFIYSAAVELEVGLAPKEFTLSQNYPNPFNPSTTLEFTLEKDGKAVVKVYDMLGRHVATLFDGEALAGRINRVQFNASSLSSGIYVSTLESDNKHLVKKMLLLK